MIQRIIIGCTLGVSAAVVLAACGGTAGGQPPNASPGGRGTGSAETARPTQPSTAPPSSAGQCRDDAHLTVDPAHPPAPICLRVGHVLHVSTTVSPHQPWESLASSDPGVVTCESTHVADGAVQAACTGQKPGTTIISTQTMPFQGDPHGPAQVMWQITVTVTK